MVPLRSVGGVARTISMDELREIVDEIATDRKSVV